MPEAEAETTASVSNRGILAAICCVVMFFYAVYFGAFGVLLPYLGTAFGLGAAAEGRLFPANFAGFVVSVLLGEIGRAHV